MSTENNSEESVSIKVEKLDPKSSRVNLIVKVVSKSEPRETVSKTDGSTHSVVDALVGDETGSIYLTLWDDNIEKIKNEDVLELKNVYVSLFRGAMRLNLGRYGSFESSEKSIEVNTDNNLSDRQLEPPRRRPTFRPAFPSSEPRGRRRRFRERR